MFLGLDLGTSGLRGLLIDAAQRTVAVAEASYPTARPAPGHSEQDPRDWIAACRTVIAALKAEAPTEMAALRGIGCSGHMHGAVLLGADDAEQRPCIMWNDTRSADQAARLDAAADVRALSGNIVFPGFTAPKLMWVAEHEPEILARTARVVLPKDYLTLWLTGAHATDMSDASGTSWLDVGARDWSDRLLAASGMTRDQMPALHEGTVPVGTIRPGLADELGLPRGVVVAAGAADNAAAACGIGALEHGDGFVSLGTSGVLLAARDRFAPKPESAVHTFCHAVPGRWYQMGVILAATDSLNWLARNLQADPAALTAALGDRIGPPGRLRFLPYLSGERTPHNDSAIRGAFIGLDIGMGHAELTHAVLEGVGYALRDSLDALRDTGAALKRVTAIGGGSASRYWLELLATLLDLPIDRPARGEFGAAMGAARLATCAATGAAPEAVMIRPPIAETIAPRDDLRAEYAAGHAAYRNLYPAIRALQS
ncbi:xylulokinase [Jhaorihella thermophila]|uniref:Xylulose kinase n=1 Tax=Jhaorihella thermophila TaxID=488547 RepID=A0A1H5V2S7_9RHOB|nr:xylulokinase [Jhaorihella thermophila]SEF81038.1 xylulokinase [Jhaorihella thermophila]